MTLMFEQHVKPVNERNAELLANVEQLTAQNFSLAEMNKEMQSMVGFLNSENKELLSKVGLLNSELDKVKRQLNDETDLFHDDMSAARTKIQELKSAVDSYAFSTAQLKRSLSEKAQATDNIPSASCSERELNFLRGQADKLSYMLDTFNRQRGAGSEEENLREFIDLLLADNADVKTLRRNVKALQAELADLVRLNADAELMNFDPPDD